MYIVSVFFQSCISLGGGGGGVANLGRIDKCKKSILTTVSYTCTLVPCFHKIDNFFRPQEVSDPSSSKAELLFIVSSICVWFGPCFLC